MPDRVFRRDLATLDVPVADVVVGASAVDLDSVAIVGRTRDGKLYFASSDGDSAAILWLLKHAKTGVLERSWPGLAG